MLSTARCEPLFQGTGNPHGRVWDCALGDAVSQNDAVTGGAASSWCRLVRGRRAEASLGGHGTSPPAVRGGLASGEGARAGGGQGLNLLGGAGIPPGSRSPGAGLAVKEGSVPFPVPLRGAACPEELEHRPPGQGPPPPAALPAPPGTGSSRALRGALSHGAGGRAGDRDRDSTASGEDSSCLQGKWKAEQAGGTASVCGTGEPALACSTVSGSSKEILKYRRGVGKETEGWREGVESPRSRGHWGGLTSPREG